MKSARNATLAALAAVTLGLVAVLLLDDREPTGAGGRRRKAPVAVASIERGPIELRRTYSGTLEAPAQFFVAAKVAGRVERLTVDLGDTVRRGQSAQGNSSVAVTFAWDKDIDTAALDLQGKLEDEISELGTGTALLVAQAQRDLLASRIAEVQAIVAYRSALVRLYLAEGTLLARRGVLIGSR